MGVKSLYLTFDREVKGCGFVAGGRLGAMGEGRETGCWNDRPCDLKYGGLERM